MYLDCVAATDVADGEAAAYLEPVPPASKRPVDPSPMTSAAAVFAGGSTPSRKPSPGHGTPREARDPVVEGEPSEAVTAAPPRTTTAAAEKASTGHADDGSSGDGAPGRPEPLAAAATGASPARRREPPPGGTAARIQGYVRSRLLQRRVGTAAAAADRGTAAAAVPASAALAPPSQWPADAADAAARTIQRAARAALRRSDRWRLAALERQLRELRDRKRQELAAIASWREAQLAALRREADRARERRRADDARFRLAARVRLDQLEELLEGRRRLHREREGLREDLRRLAEEHRGLAEQLRAQQHGVSLGRTAVINLTKENTKWRCVEELYASHLQRLGAAVAARREREATAHRMQGHYRAAVRRMMTAIGAREDLRLDVSSHVLQLMATHLLAESHDEAVH